MARYRILTFDGGGIRGYFTTRVLERLVGEVPRLLDSVDLVAGTSTGGLIALGLAAGKSPAELSALYRDEGPGIFDDSLWDNIRDLGRVAGADYSLKNLRKVTERVFGARRLRDLRLRVLIPTFDLDNEAADPAKRSWKPKFFHNFPGPDSDGGERARDVALRTAAAPTYFPSYQGFIDGGVVANNPSMAAVALALDSRGGGRQLEDLVLCSVGTGRNPTYIRGRSKDWGYAQWATTLPGLLVDGVMGVADFQCRQILGPDRYRRVDTILGRKIPVDGVAYLDDLRKAADSVDLEETVDWLASHFA